MAERQLELVRRAAVRLMDMQKLFIYNVSLYSDLILVYSVVFKSSITSTAAISESDTQNTLGTA